VDNSLHGNRYIVFVTVVAQLNWLGVIATTAHEANWHPVAIETLCISEEWGVSAACMPSRKHGFESSCVSAIEGGILMSGAKLNSLEFFSCFD
jgi:hypothetical protein